MGATIAARFGAEPRQPIAPPTLAEIELRAPRIEPPASLAALCTDRSVRTREPHLRQVVSRHLARAAPRLLATTRPDRNPADRSRCRVAARLVLATLGSRRFRTAVARRSSAASSATSTRATTAVHSRSICARSTGSSRSIAPRARRASKPASTDPPSKTSCARTASPCATSPNPSSSRRWADGSRPDRAGTTRRCTRTSTISSSRSAR